MADDDIWSPRSGVRKTTRECILLYLSQEGEATARDLRNEIRMTRDVSEQHLGYLEENGFLNKSLHVGRSDTQYSLTEEGENLVAEIRWGGDSQIDS